MNKPINPVSLMILGKEYKIVCAPEEQESLIRSAKALDKQMRKIRDTGKVSGADRIAVLAALNLSHDSSNVEEDAGDGHDEKLCNRLRDLRQKIEKALEMP